MAYQELTAEHVRALTGRPTGEARLNVRVPAELAQAAQAAAQSRGISVTALVERALATAISFVTSEEAAAHVEFARHARRPTADTLTVFAGSSHATLIEMNPDAERGSWLRFEVERDLSAAGMTGDELDRLLEGVDWRAIPPDPARLREEQHRRAQAESRWWEMVARLAQRLRKGDDVDIENEVRHTVNPGDVATTLAEIERLAASDEPLPWPTPGRVVPW